MVHSPFYKNILTYLRFLAVCGTHFQFSTTSSRFEPSAFKGKYQEIMWCTIECSELPANVNKYMSFLVNQHGHVVNKPKSGYATKNK